MHDGNTNKEYRAYVGVFVIVQRPLLLQGDKMRILKISDKYFEIFPPEDYELLYNKEGGKKQRPYFVLISLVYKGKRRNFAIPFRSNIPPTAAKSEYFPLPNRPSTRKHFRHGLHFLKMFPADKKFYQKFHISEDDAFWNLLHGILHKRQSAITKQAQEYLTAYENGSRHVMASKIDEIMEILYEDKEDKKEIPPRW